MDFNLHKLIKVFFTVQKKIKLFLDPQHKLIKQELKRLRNIPRYNSTMTWIMGRKIELVDSCTFLVGYHEIFDQKIYQFNASRKNPLIIDCGANIGLSIIFFKQLYPQSHIIAFEPDPTIFGVLQKNLLTWEFSDIELHQKAIWTEETVINFNTEGAYSGRIPKPGDEENLINVETIRLRNFLEQRVDFLKIDIEGAETAVILDCQDLLHNVELIFLEYHSHIHEKQKLHDILQVISKAGFRYHIHDAFSYSRPFVNRETMLGMDLQLNIFCYRD